MRTIYRSYLYAILLFAIVSLQCNPKSSQKDERKTGLILLDKGRYESLTKADLPFGASDKLPSYLDYSADLPPVRSQGQQQSCVAWATAYALKFYEEKKENNSDVEFSPSFIYNQINKGKDGGSSFMDALNVLSQQGAALWNDMPYDEKDYLTKPTDAVKEKAKPYGIENWRRVNTADMKEVKILLNSGYPVIIGAHIDEDFRSAKPTGPNGYVYNKKGGQYAGTHAMLVVGFDDSKNAFKVMNSWGPTWGNNGFCWIDYQFFQEIVAEGYIAYDKKTNVTPDTNPDTKPDNTVNNNVLDNNDKTVYDPTQFRRAGITNIQVLYNQTDPTYGAGMKIVGVIDIPQGTGKTFQFSVHFYYDGTTTQVGSAQSPQFADVNGYAATGTILYSIPNEGLNNWRFEAFMPYTAFNIPVGGYVNGTYQYKRTTMYAIPTLFIDNFGYAKGDQIRFYVDR